MSDIIVSLISAMEPMNEAVNEPTPLNADEPASSQDDAAPRALRRYFAEHNRQALLLAFFALVSSAFLWALIYFFVYWFALVGVTVSRSMNIQTLDQINRPDLVGRYFSLEFAAGAVLVLAVAWMVRRWRLRVETLRDKRHYFLWIIAELLLAVPNVTFSIWGNLAAVTRLRRHEAADAWKLLQRIHEEGGRLSLAGLRQEIENEATLHHVVFALQLVGLVSVREYTQGWFLCLHNRNAFTLLRRAAEDY